MFEGWAKPGLQTFFWKNYLPVLIVFFLENYLPVLIGSSRVVFLIMLWAHKENHDGRDVAMSIPCSKAWILNAKCLATSVVKSCLRFRFLHKVKVEQEMAILPPEIQLTYPPF